jgi:hypothetical protein
MLAAAFDHAARCASSTDAVAGADGGCARVKSMAGKRPVRIIPGLLFDARTRLFPQGYSDRII